MVAVEQSGGVRMQAQSVRIENRSGSAELHDVLLVQSNLLHLVAGYVFVLLVAPCLRARIGFWLLLLAGHSALLLVDGHAARDALLLAGPGDVLVAGSFQATADVQKQLLVPKWRNDEKGDADNIAEGEKVQKLLLIFYINKLRIMAQELVHTGPCNHKIDSTKRLE